MKLSIEEAIPQCISNLRTLKEEGSRKTVSAECLFPPSFIGFAGHFPKNPILPAIVQLAAVRCIAEHVLQQQLAVEKYSRTKFRAMIRPDQKVVFQLAIDVSEDGCNGQFHLFDDAQEKIAEGRFAYSTLT